MLFLRAHLPGPGASEGAITVQPEGGEAVKVSVRIEVERTPAVQITIDPNPVVESTPDSDGYKWFYTVRVTEQGGVASKLTRFLIGGNDYSTKIREWFGTDALPARGTLSVSLRTKGLTASVERAFEAGGVEAETGRSWTAKVSALFRSAPSSAIRLTVTPNPVVEDPSSMQCAWRHEFGIEETSGKNVTLTSWKAGGYDLTPRITEFFRMTRAVSFSTGLCWSRFSGPGRVTFEVEGLVEGGGKVKAEATADFLRGPAWTAAPVGEGRPVDDRRR